MSIGQPCGQEAVKHPYVGLTEHVYARMYALLHHPHKIILRLLFLHHSHEQGILAVCNYACMSRIDIYRQIAVLSLFRALDGQTVSPSSLMDHNGVGVIGCHLRLHTLVDESVVLVKCISRLERHLTVSRILVVRQPGYSQYQFVVVADAHGLLDSRLHFLFLGDVEVVEPV